MKENKKENFRIKFKYKLISALAVLIILSGTALAGTVLQTVTAPSVGITAKILDPISGSMQITLKSAPDILDFGQTDYIKFTIVNEYPVTVKITSMGVPFYINHELTVVNSNIQGNIVTSQVFLYNEYETQFITATEYNNFCSTGLLVPANSITVLRIPVTMPSNQITVKDSGNNQFLYTVKRGDVLNLNLVLGVSES